MLAALARIIPMGIPPKLRNLPVIGAAALLDGVALIALTLLPVALCIRALSLPVPLALLIGLAMLTALALLLFGLLALQVPLALLVRLAVLAALALLLFGLLPLPVMLALLIRLAVLAALALLLLGLLPLPVMLLPLVPPALGPATAPPFPRRGDSRGCQNEAEHGRYGKSERMSGVTRH
jgi:hypothetical protein